MAAGLGTRLRPLTATLPKPMVPIANRPVLHHLLNLLARHDIHEVGINIHVFPELIRGYFGDGSALGMSIRWSEETELLGTAGGTKRLEGFWGREPILVTSGDGLHDVDVTALIGHHRRAGGLATLAVKPVDDPSAYGVVIVERDTRISGFQEKPHRDEARSDLASCGVYVIEPELLDRVPKDTFYDFGQDVWPSLVAAGEPVYAYTTMAYWNDVGGLDELRNSILDAVGGRVRIEIPGREIAPGVWAEDGCEIDSSAIVEGPVVLGRNVTIEAGALIRGPAAIGADSRVGRGAAIRSAALLPGSVVPDGGDRDRRDLRRRVEARGEHPPLPGRARLVTNRAERARRARVASRHRPRRSSPPGALRGLRPLRGSPLRVVSRPADSSSPAALRALRCACRLGGRALPRLRGEAPRLRAGARGGRLRRHRRPSGLGVEGGWPPEPRRRRRGPRDERRGASGGGHDHLRPRSDGSWPLARPQPGGRARPCASERPGSCRSSRCSHGSDGGAGSTASPSPQRRANLNGAFTAVAAPPIVLLVDDVYTTGSTAAACAARASKRGCGTRGGGRVRPRPARGILAKAVR